MNSTNHPTTAALLIDSLTPKERAILYCTLLSKKEDIETELVHLLQTTNNHPKIVNRQSDFYRWYIRECNEILQKLFSECFLSDMEILPFFQKDVPLSVSARVHS